MALFIPYTSILTFKYNMKHAGYNELVNYIKQKDWQIFGTLTFKFDVSKEQAEKELNKFWNIIDRKLYGNLSWRKNIRSERLCFLQNGKINENNHIHFVANTIDGIDVKDFIIILEYFWRKKIKSSGKENVIEQLENLEAASKYSMHEFYKLGNDTLALTCSNIKKTN
jgi:hypothetical protein